MPTVKRTNDGHVIISRKGRRYITHQLTTEGIEWLSARFGDLEDGMAIDVSTLMDLRHAGHAYIPGRQPHPVRVKGMRWTEYRPHAPEPKKPQPAPQPTTAQPQPATVACVQCGGLLLETAQFCGRCGWPLNGRIGASSPVRPARSAPHLIWYALLAAILALCWLLARQQGFFRG